MSRQVTARAAAVEELTRKRSRNDKPRGQAKIRVELVRRPVTREIQVRVSLSSAMRPNLWSQLYCDPDAANLEHKVSVMAGALAEHQCLEYGDRHDPASIAKQARRMLLELKEKGRRADEKVRRR